jgi:hypothetical protein
MGFFSRKRPPEPEDRPNDPDALARVRARVEELGGDDACPHLTVDEFFTGNGQSFSIATNLPRHPGIDAFARTLREIEQRPEVSAVRVEVAEAVPDEDDWPYSDRVFIVTSASTAEVARWAEVLDPDEPKLIVGAYEEPECVWGWRDETPPGAPPIPSGEHVVELWWD